MDDASGSVSIVQPEESESTRRMEGGDQEESAPRVCTPERDEMFDCDADPLLRGVPGLGSVTDLMMPDLLSRVRLSPLFHRFLVLFWFLSLVSQSPWFFFLVFQHTIPGLSLFSPCFTDPWFFSGFPNKFSWFVPCSSPVSFCSTRKSAPTLGLLGPSPVVRFRVPPLLGELAGG